MQRLGILLAFLLCVANANAADYFWVIGGGPNPHDSQAQIEANVKWVIQVIHAREPKAVLHVFFAGGPNAKDDVRSWIPREDTAQNLQPLARVFGEQRANGNRFRDQDVPQVEGSTEAPQLAARLAQQFSSLKPGDHAFILFEGHGEVDFDHPSQNTVRLWNDTQMTAREFERLLDNINPQVPVQFVFTQCYSGAYERLIHPQAKATDEFTPGVRCGFMAQSARRETEGCSASVNTGDYRDYTTYFFAALSGHTRQGDSLPANSIISSSGTTIPYDAHLYALREAYSTDMPRSTSEMFLTSWQPWYLRWFDTGYQPDNVYGRIAREVARSLGLPPDGHELIRDLDSRRRHDVQQIAALRAERTNLYTQIHALEKQMQKSVVLHWPSAAQPYTKNFIGFMQNDLSAAQSFIVSSPDYPKLVAMQDRAEALGPQILDLRRDRTQLDKIRRMRRLARILAQFQLHASPQARANYHRLLSCEERPL